MIITKSSILFSSFRINDFEVYSDDLTYKCSVCSFETKKLAFIRDHVVFFNIFIHFISLMINDANEINNFRHYLTLNTFSIVLLVNFKQSLITF